jgi:LacI family transcriptional regulator
MNHAGCSKERLRVEHVIVTIKDVAQRAGVSPKTVSRVLNNETHVRPQLRETVMRVIEELNYKPNMFARGLSSARSYLIGLFIYDPYWSGYATDIQLGALRAAASWAITL